MRMTEDGDVLLTKREYMVAVGTVPASHGGILDGLFGSSDKDSGPGFLEDFQIRHEDSIVETDPPIIDFTGSSVEIVEPSEYENGVRIKISGGDGSGGTSSDGLTEDVHPFSETGSVAAGDAGLIMSTQVPDGSSYEVTQAGLLLADGQPAPSNLDLVIVTMDNTGASTKQATVISGDGTVQNDETGSPIASYANDTGSEQTVSVAVDNGQYNAGTGSPQDVMADGHSEVV